MKVLLTMLLMPLVIFTCVGAAITEGSTRQPESGHHVARGDEFLQERKYSRAIEEYSQEIQADPAAAIAYDNRASAYLRLREYQKAIDDTSMAIQLVPNDDLAYLNRGVCYFHLKKYDQSLADLRKALELSPGNPAVCENLGVLYWEQGDRDNAKRYLEKARKGYVRNGMRKEAHETILLLRKLELGKPY